MDRKDREKLVECVLVYLNHEKQRCTYGALASMLGVKPIEVSAYLGNKRPETSWVVAADTGKPTKFTEDQLAEGLCDGSEPIVCSNALSQKVSDFHSVRKALWMRRWAMIDGHIEAVDRLVGLTLGLTTLIPQIGTTKSGRPRAPNNVRDWLNDLEPHKQASLIGTIAAINVNLGYAYEQTFKLLLDMEKVGIGEAYPPGNNGHKLPILYSLLCEETKESICDLYGKIDQTDLEFQENFSKNAARYGFPNQRNSERPTFYSDLIHYQELRYFQQSRYKYVDVDIRRPIFCILPLRFSELIKDIHEQVVSPRLALARTPHQAQPKVDWDGQEFKLELPIDNKVLKSKIAPRYVYIVQLRKAGTKDWGAGFKTPFIRCQFSNLKPHTEYESKVTPLSDGKKGEPTYAKARTSKDGRWKPT